jgi:hypothetical protein
MSRPSGWPVGWGVGVVRGVTPGWWVGWRRRYLIACISWSADSSCSRPSLRPPSRRPPLLQPPPPAAARHAPRKPSSKRQAPPPSPVPRLLLTGEEIGAVHGPRRSAVDGVKAADGVKLEQGHEHGACGEGVACSGCCCKAGARRARRGRLRLAPLLRHSAAGLAPKGEGMTRGRAATAPRRV